MRRRLLASTTACDARSAPNPSTRNMKDLTERRRNHLERLRLMKLGKPSTFTGKRHSEATKQKMSLSKKGKSFSAIHRLRISSSLKKRMAGSGNPNWKGGLKPDSTIRQIRNSTEYKLWRRAVFERDNYTCIWCLKRGGNLNADHIKSFKHYPELRFAIDNGRTLCFLCHKTTATFAGRGRKKI